MLNDKHKVTVLLPVGPNKIYQEYVSEAIDSVYNQTYPANELLLVDDGAHITDQNMHDWFDRDIFWSGGIARYEDYWYDESTDLNIKVWHSPANVGFAQAFNCGVALASNELIVYLAADDTLAPDAIKDCIEAWEENSQRDAWYAMTYSDAGRVDDTPINCAMVSKNLWAFLGGYPPAAFAGPDAALLSIMMIHLPDRIIRVAQGKVNYTIRKHDWQETKVTAQRFSTEMTSIRNTLTRDFKPVEGVVLK